jgi:hypothetical protein
MNNLGFKQITPSNWMECDEVLTGFVKFSPDGQTSTIPGEEYIKHILEPIISNSVPIEVKKLFEVARGIMVYGFFFYPLYAIGTEQLYRVIEAAVYHKCKELNVPKKVENYYDKIEWLLKIDAINEEESKRLHVARIARNISSHLESQMIILPFEAINSVKMAIKYIDILYK